MWTRILNAGIAGPAVVAALTLLTLAPAQADDTSGTSCVGTFGSQNCVTIWRGGVTDPYVRDLAPLTQQEIAEGRERDQRWRERCRPSVERDHYGVARYVYSRPGCEFGASAR
jgi:hypothetical protein